MSKFSLLSLPAWLTEEVEDFRPLSVITNGQTILDELEGHQMSLQVLQDGGTDNIGSFVEDISQWQTTLRQIEIVVRLWIGVQEKWLELEEVLKIICRFISHACLEEKQYIQTHLNVAAANAVACGVHSVAN